MILKRKEFNWIKNFKPERIFYYFAELYKKEYFKIKKVKVVNTYYGVIINITFKYLDEEKNRFNFTHTVNKNNYQYYHF